MNQKRTDMATLLGFAFKKVETDPNFIAYEMKKYLEREKIKQNDLIEMLLCDLEQYLKLGLCRVPIVESGNFGERTYEIAKYCNCNIEVLEQIIKSNKPQPKPIGSESKKVICFFDGCCEPRNPGGNMGTGATVYVDEKNVHNHSQFYPAKSSNSNNVAEYLAFEAVLQYIIDNELSGEDIIIYGDSMLVVSQMRGEWRIKNGMYTGYAKRCQGMIETIFLKNNREKRPDIKWIPRDQNAIADELSKAKLIKNNIPIILQKPMV